MIKSRNVNLIETPTKIMITDNRLHNMFEEKYILNFSQHICQNIWVSHWDIANDIHPFMLRSEVRTPAPTTNHEI